MTGEQTMAMVVPGDADDPCRPSGGNTYDRRLRDGLRRAGWCVSWHPVSGDWPHGSREACAGLGRVLAGAPPSSTLLVDGLVACGAPDVVLPVARRRPVVVLAHMPFDHSADALRAAHAVIVTSEWCRDRVLATHALEPARVHVVPPGTDPAEPSPQSEGGGNLLCVASLTPGKGHDVLLDGLARLPDLAWTCTCVGSLDRAPDFAARLGGGVRAAGLSSRMVLAGPRTGPALEASYRAADLLVLASRTESWGMVVTEALARGIPVLGTDVGGVPEALGTTADGHRPGRLVPPGDEVALASALRQWLEDAKLRHQLRAAALARRPGLPGWENTASRVADLLTGVPA